MEWSKKVRLTLLKKQGFLYVKFRIILQALLKQHQPTLLIWTNQEKPKVSE